MNIYQKAKKLIVHYGCAGEVVSRPGCGMDDRTAVGKGGTGGLMENHCKP